MKEEPLRKRFGECVRMYLAGKVSCDHLVGEYGGASDPELKAVLEQIAARASRDGSYAVPTVAGREYAAEVGAMLESLEGR